MSEIVVNSGLDSIFPDRADQSSIPVFNRKDIELEKRFSFCAFRKVSHWEAGAEKRVVMISILGKEGKVPAVLKLIRPHLLIVANQGLSYEERKEAVKKKIREEGESYKEFAMKDPHSRKVAAEEEFKALQLLYKHAPNHFPKPLGVYRHGEQSGVIVERVFGDRLAYYHPNDLPYLKERQEFTENILSLLKTGILLHHDMFETRNLFFGHTQSNKEKRVICIEATIPKIPTVEAHISSALTLIKLMAEPSYKRFD